MGMLIHRQHNLTEYFREMVDRTTASLAVQLAETSQYYLVNLLNGFHRTEKFFAKDADHYDETPLAILLERAVHGDSPSTRIRNLQRLGDTALFVAGYFPQRTRRRLVNADYYIGMGGGAYLSLASMFNTGETFSEIYGELGEKFANCVNIIAEVKRAARGQCNEDLLAMYERWLDSGDTALERILNREGIATNERKKHQS